MTRQWFFLFFWGGQIEVCFLLPPEKNDTLPYDDFFLFFFYIFGYVNILHSIRFCNQNQPALVPSVTHICHCRVNQSHVSKVLPDRVKNTSKAHSRTVNICVWCQQFFFFSFFSFCNVIKAKKGVAADGSSAGCLRPALCLAGWFHLSHADWTHCSLQWCRFHVKTGTLHKVPECRRGKLSYFMRDCAVWWSACETELWAKRFTAWHYTTFNGLQLWCLRESCPASM